LKNIFFSLIFSSFSILREHMQMEEFAKKLF